MPIAAKAPSAAALNRTPRESEIDVFGLTHPGKIRKTNNDHFLIASLHKRMDVVMTSLPALQESASREEHVAFVVMVADGVGVDEAGEEASRIVLESVTDFLSTSLQAYYAAEGREDALQRALQEAASRSHANVLRRAKERADSRTRATTLTLYLGIWPWTYLLQVGDSRYYDFRDGQLTQHTRDQTFAQDLVDSGAFSRAQAAGSRFKNVLSSALGGNQAEPVVTRVPADWRTIHLMCSDGLTKHVSDERIRQRLATMTSAKQVCEELLQDALDDGGTDNVTVIVGRVVPDEAVRSP